MNISFLFTSYLVPPSSPVFRYETTDDQLITESQLKVIEGDTFNITCVSGANPSPNYEWTGEFVSNQQELRVTNASRTMTTQKCTVTNTMTETHGQSNVAGKTESVLAVDVMCE